MTSKTLLLLALLPTLLLAAPRSAREITMDADTNALVTLGGGCFWCIEAVFRRVEGVLGATSGYMGGSEEHPTYAQVSSGETGHVEVVQVRFDPRRLGYRQLLEVFFAVHDPTDAEGQGNDRGSQYRPVVFFHSPEQQREARILMGQLEQSHHFERPLATALEPAVRFWPAEEYHQAYYETNGAAPYCRIIIGPKVEKLRKKFAALAQEPLPPH
jgi:peptide-methionine (S)-S-oxide reductase